jgi:hypothetical protein
MRWRTQVTREMSGWMLADRLGQDIRHGWRRLWARPATTCLAIAMLGLAVGITTSFGLRGRRHRTHVLGALDERRRPDACPLQRAAP